MFAELADQGCTLHLLQKVTAAKTVWATPSAALPLHAQSIFADQLTDSLGQVVNHGGCRGVGRVVKAGLQGPCTAAGSRQLYATDWTHRQLLLVLESKLWGHRCAQIMLHTQLHTQLSAPAVL